MRRFLKVFLTLLLLFVIAAVAAPFLIPADTLKEKVLAGIEEKTGRKVAIGKVSFALFPTVALEAEDVSVSNPGWAGGGSMAQIKKLKFGLELMPLLHKEYRVKELILEAPVLSLVKIHGRANWDFSAVDATVAPAAAAAAPAKVSSSGGAVKLGNLHLDEISITGGSATYKDDASPAPQSVSDLNLLLKAPDLNEKAELKLSGVVDGKKLHVGLTLERPLAYQSGKPTDVALDATYEALRFTWTGTAKSGRGAVPTITGKLTIPALDTADFSRKDAADKAAASQGRAAPPPPANASRWSDAPIRLDALNGLDGDLTLSIGKLTLPKTSLENVSAAIHLHQGALQVVSDSVNAYGGTVKLGFGANPAGAISLSFQASHAEAEPLLHDFASYDRLSGIIDLQMKLAASGLSQRALIGSMSGTGSVHFSNGKLKGVNIAGLLRNITGAQGSDDNATDFSELSATFTAARGIIATNDLKLSSPLLRVTGSGQADLPNWQEHFLLSPILVASAQGQGGKDMTGIIVPVRVDGPIDHPHYQPDLKAALKDNLENLKDPSKLKQSVKDLKKSLLHGGGLGGLLR